jgi:hypothetical protein
VKNEAMPLFQMNGSEMVNRRIDLDFVWTGRDSAA